MHFNTVKMSSRGYWDFIPCCLQMNKLFISDGAIKLNWFCYSCSLCGATISLAYTTSSSCTICNMIGTNLWWLVPCKMPQVTHCCAPEGRWWSSYGRGFTCDRVSRKQPQILRSSEVIKTVTFTIDGLSVLVKVWTACTSGASHCTPAHLILPFSTADFVM